MTASYRSNRNFAHALGSLAGGLLLGCLWLQPTPSLGQDPAAPAEAASEQESANDAADAEDPLEQILAGHSIHGDAFNEGPRQAAYLMGGTGNVHFPVTTASSEAQAFINQGVGQLHGFWYLEAERSFRQAAMIDPDCAMAYWGAAMAAYAQRERAQGFIAEAVKRKEGTTDREKQYIDALEKYFSDKEKDKSKRAQNLLKDLETIVIDYPDDVEAKAFVTHRIWHNGREGIPISSYVATDSLINEVLRAEPLHPAHHYTIHLWDYRKPEKALASAARCGPSAPSIAHMWHMPGHIYSRLHRYEDAVYQQEASARVDHAHMMRDRVMPDEINNFAHNNEWLIRNLVFLGRAEDALDLAKNMVELPRHPKYNTLEKKSGSASYGRRRLLQVLREFEMHAQAVDLCQSAYLIENDLEEEKIKTLRLLGCAAIMSGAESLGTSTTGQLQSMLQARQTRQEELEQRVKELEGKLKPTKSESDAEAAPADTPEDDGDQESDCQDPGNQEAGDQEAGDKQEDGAAKSSEEFDPKKAQANLDQAKKELAEVKQLVKQLEKALLAIEAYQAAAAGDYASAFPKLEKATGEDVSLIAEWQFQAGETDEALEKLKKQVERRPQEVIPLARLAYAYHQNGQTDLAHETFQLLRTASNSMDLTLPMFQRLAPLARELDLPEDWRKPHQAAADVGYRPPLDSLGPFRWSPQPAPTWALTDSRNLSAGSQDYAGKPHIVIFYLGHGCLHCAEQLQAFAPRLKDFQEAGIDMVAVSSDDREGLQKSIEDAGGENFGIRLVSNGELDVFKKFRAYDDFEKQPLHGTFLIDGKGMVRWQDIGYEPFMDHEFLLKEAQRLLAEQQAEVGP